MTAARGPELLREPRRREEIRELLLHACEHHECAGGG
jgi:hypothetical protein